MLTILSFFTFVTEPIAYEIAVKDHHFNARLPFSEAAREKHASGLYFWLDIITKITAFVIFAEIVLPLPFVAYFSVVGVPQFFTVHKQILPAFFMYWRRSCNADTTNFF
jgi:hypothetical protein